MARWNYDIMYQDYKLLSLQKPCKQYK